MTPKSTIAEVIQHIEEKCSNPNAFNFIDKGHWKHISTETFIFDLKRLTYGLVSLGVKRGDNIGILAQSSPYWTLIDLAIMMAGGVTVPLMSQISKENLIYEVAQSNVSFVFVYGEEEWAIYNDHRNLFEKAIVIDQVDEKNGILQFHEIMRKGESLWEKEPNLWNALKAKLHADDVCSIIYTAGATGIPKGVEMTQKSFCHLIGFDVYGWSFKDDVYLSILPLAHVFSRQINLIMAAWGVRIYYLNDLSRLKAVCQEIKPSLMIVVPRLLDRMYDGMVTGVERENNGIKRAIGRWAFKLANSPKQSIIKRFIFRPIADFFVYSHLRAALGGNWRVILCGGAALSVPLQKFFLNCGFPIFEGWGLTEASTVCVNRPNAFKVGTVGIPLPGLKIKLGQMDEVLVNGPTVMNGYYRNPEATKKAINEDGWLHTGDKGYIDEEGFLTLIGRVKEQFKLSTGEYVSPSRIEYLLKQHPLVDQAMVIGERQRYAACFLFPKKENLQKWKEKYELENQSDEEFLSSEIVKNEITKLLADTSARLNRSEKLFDYRFILEEPTIDGGELTPTFKLRRDVILEKYQNLVEEIYGEGRL